MRSGKVEFAAATEQLSGARSRKTLSENKMSETATKCEKVENGVIRSKDR